MKKQPNSKPLQAPTPCLWEGSPLRMENLPSTSLRRRPQRDVVLAYLSSGGVSCLLKALLLQTSSRCSPASLERIPAREAPFMSLSGAEDPAPASHTFLPFHSSLCCWKEGGNWCQDRGQALWHQCPCRSSSPPPPAVFSVPGNRCFRKWTPT